MQDARPFHLTPVGADPCAECRFFIVYDVKMRFLLYF